MKCFYIIALILLFGCTAQKELNYNPVQNSTIQNNLNSPNNSTALNNTITPAETPKNISTDNQSGLQEPANNKTYDLYVYYFHRTTCQFCQKVNPAVDDLELKYPNVKFYRFETGSNSTNLAFFHKVASAYNISMESRGVPIVYIDSEYLLGDQRIITYLEGEIKACLKYPCVKNPIDNVKN